MGNKTSKSRLRNAIIFLNISADEISIEDDNFWDQIFSEDVSVAEDVIKHITVQEIRMLRDGSPRNFATLAYKMVDRFALATGTLCNTQRQQTAILNASKILTRVLPCFFEDSSWRTFFEDNTIDSTGESKQMKYPEKKINERNYTAYVPLKSGSRSASPYDKQDRGLSPRCDAQSNRAAADAQEYLLDEQLLLSEIDDIKLNDGSTQDLNNSARENHSLMQTLIFAICDLLFCPEFTVLSHGDSYLANAVDGPPEDLKSLSTHDYVWEPGVGFDSSVNSTTYHDKNRIELLRTLLVCLSMTLYEPPEKSINLRNKWIELFVSKENRHALPLFTSLLNVVFGYKQPGPVVQLNNLLYENNRDRLVEISCQLLIAVLDYNLDKEGACADAKNSFIEYMSRIHRDEDLEFLIKGFIRLFKYNLERNHSWVARTINLDQELQMLLWKILNLNKKFVQFLLKTNDFLDIVVPILYHLNENFQEPSRTALIHMGVFNLLMLSGERNFGVRLNKQYSSNMLSNLPDFTGSHADLMILVFHKLIMYGYKINQLYDYLLTILVNVSPYLKGATILACKCLMQLFETFSSVYVVFTEPNYHQLVIFLLEIFNNLIQYQFDGNANLVYMILAKKSLFLNLLHLPTAQKSIDKVLNRLAKQKELFEQSEKEINNNERDKTNDNQIFDKIEELEESIPSSATVSCSENESASNKIATKQEVSLVATPDLKHITQSVHPFDFSMTAVPLYGDRSCPETDKQNISLVDILNETDKLETDSEKSSIMKNKRPFSGGDQTMFEDIGERGNPFRSVNAVKQRMTKSDRTSRSSKWSPTTAWLKEWKRGLPLETIHRMISALEPQLEQLKASRGRSLDEAEIIKFLQNGTLVGLLPVPHPIQIRKYKTNNGSTMWLRACTWGVIYVRSTTWTGTDIRLIKIL